jgi:hypothetical protein
LQRKRKSKTAKIWRFRFGLLALRVEVSSSIDSAVFLGHNRCCMPFFFGADEESNGVFEIVCALWRRLDLLFGFRCIVIRYCKFSFVSPAFASFFSSVFFFFLVGLVVFSGMFFAPLVVLCFRKVL